MSVMESHLETFANIAALGFGLCLLVAGGMMLVSTL